MSYTSKHNYKRNRSAQEPEGLPKTPLKVQDNQEQEEQKSELDSQKGDGDDEASVASTSSPSKKKKKDKKDKKKVVVQQATYQMKELGGLVFKKIQDFEHGLRQLAATEVEYKVSQFIPKNQQSTLDVIIHSHPEVSTWIHDGDAGWNRDWREWPEEDLFKALYVLFPQSPTAAFADIVDTLKHRLQELKIHLNPFLLMQCAIKLQQDIHAIVQDHIDTLSASENKSLIKVAIDILDKDQTADIYREIKSRMKQRQDQLTNFHLYLRALLEICYQIESVISAALKIGMKFNAKGGRGDNPQGGRQRDNRAAGGAVTARETTSTTDGQTTTVDRICWGCGRQNHAQINCTRSWHPDWNNEKKPWAQSTFGIAWKAQGQDVLPKNLNLKGETVRPPKKSEKLLQINELIANQANEPAIPGNLQANDATLRVRCLIDTGAIQGNYMSARVAKWLKENGKKSCKCNRFIFSAFASDCGTKADECFEHALFIYNPILKSDQQLDLNFAVIESNFDIIIGYNAIKRYDLVTNFAYLFKDTDAMRSTGNTGFVGVGKDDGLAHTSKQAGTPNQSRPVVSTSHVSQVLHTSTSDNNDDKTLADDETPWDRVVDGEATDKEDEPHFHGPSTLQTRVRYLCKQKHGSVFSTELRKEPADLPPMEIEVDRAIWESLKTNRLPPRVQTVTKQQETQRQVEVMEGKDVVKPEPLAQRYSQVMLTPKPNNKWRFAIDYEPLNRATVMAESWPLPNIRDVLQRIGTKKAMFYGVMDLTNGFHQAPLSPVARILTAFITFFGVFTWLRVPMGLKGAPSYFQRVMATVVLAGLMYTACELYIDDILIFGKDEDEFVEHLDKVLTALAKRGMTVNPKKCRFGLTEIEYVGHVINAQGISHSPERVEKVLSMQKPTLAKHLKSFLGVATYFRDHIRNHSLIVKPLHEMIRKYEKNKRLEWTQEGERAYEEIREAIRHMPTLFFLDDRRESKVYLHTDASDYGYGAYLFQVVDGKEHPTAFMSGTFSGAELNWHTTEKECYAIVSALKKFEHLIRDRPFTLRTDHKSLTFLNTGISPKVRRWKAYIAEHDCDIEHIAGEANIVADAFSRLLELPSQVEHLAAQYERSEIPKAERIILGQLHNSRVGHFGVEKTVQRLQAQGKHWQYMREHVKAFIKECPCCQKMSQLRVPIHTHPFSVSSFEPMERLAIDTMGPLTKDKDGYQYIVVIIDCFSRWVELYAAKDATGMEAAQALYYHMGRYGSCTQLITDNGSQYTSELMNELIRLGGMQVHRITPYSHEENAMVERANKEVMRHVRNIVFDKKTVDDWRFNLPQVQRIMNASVNQSIGCAPADILYGGAITLDRGILVAPRTETPLNVPLSTWLANRLSMQTKIIAKAQEVQRRAQNMHESLIPPRLTSFPVGSYVLVDYPDNALRRGPPSKFLPFRQGPMLVEERVGTKYTLRNLNTKKLKDFHVSLLREFIYDPEYTDPEAVAMTDAHLFEVESILSHKGNIKRKTGLTFKVKFVGDDVIYEEPWSNLRRNTVLHAYLRDNGLVTWIPPEFR